MKPPIIDGDTVYPAYVGPYKIGKTLGQGQTGIVKLGQHCKTKEKVAIKIISKQRLKPAVLQKVEREIAIMRLIEHPHVMGLYDVYESSRFLYLVLEHVSGGELFDYLVKQGRLSTAEAVHFFRQLGSAVDFCHRYGVCHRDLKPENLLLDSNKNLKVADFGMASLQLENSLLETSCGSPHYACPEVIKGGPYDGRMADVWSCGIILYALLVGSLPFDHHDIAKLLEKVRAGKYSMPSWMPEPSKNLIQRMLQINPEKRIKLHDVLRHPFLEQGGGKEKTTSYLTPVETVLYTTPLHSAEDLDEDVVRQITSLGCFKSTTDLTLRLLDRKHNTEKVVYFLLLDRKRRQPALKDSIPLRKRWRNKASRRENPQKRVDSMKLSSTETSPPPPMRKSLCKAASVGESQYNVIRSPVEQDRRYSLGTRLDSITESTDGTTWRRFLSSAFSSSSNRSLDGSCCLTSRESGLASATRCNSCATHSHVTSHVTSRDRLTGGKRALSMSVGTSLAHHHHGAGGTPSGLVTSKSLDKTESRGLRSRLFPWRRRPLETFLVLRGTTLAQFNLDIVNEFRKFNVVHVAEEGEEGVRVSRYRCKHSSGKRSLLGQCVKFTLSAEERQAGTDCPHEHGGTVISVSIVFRSGSTKKFRRICEKLQLALFRPNSGRPFSPVFRKVYFSESEGKLTSDTDSQGSIDMLSSNCSEPSF